MKIKLETEMQIMSGSDMLWMTSTTAAKVQAELDAVNGAARAFTVKYANDIYHCALGAERYIAENGVPVSDRAGATVTFCPAGPVSNAYQSPGISTEFTLTRGRTHWYLTDVKRVAVYPGNPKRFDVKISDAAVENLVKRVVARFGGKATATRAIAA